MTETLVPLFDRDTDSSLYMTDTLVPFFEWDIRTETLLSFFEWDTYTETLVPLFDRRTGKEQNLLFEEEIHIILPFKQNYGPILFI